MIDLFQDRRIFVNQKRRQFQKNGLPDIKYHLGLVKKNPDEFIMKSQSLNNQNNILIFNSFQPLSNILISKRICPTNNPESPLIKKKHHTDKQNTKDASQKAKKQSLKRIVHYEEGEHNKKDQGALLGQFMKSQQTGMSKRNSTSLSYRIRLKEKDRDKLLIDNVSTGIDQVNGKTKLKYQQNYCTFLIPKANNNEDLVRQILQSRKIWKEVKAGQQIPNLKWLFSKQRYNYKKMFSYTQKRAVNHFQFNEQISTKDNLVRNLQIYCQTKKIQIFSITPITFIIDFDDQYCEYNLKQFLSFFSKNDPRKANGNIKKPVYNGNNFVNKFQPYMAWQNSDIKKKVNILSRPVNNNCYYGENSYLWLLKPTGLNRGRGIEIFDSLETLEKMLMSFLDQMQRKKFTQTNSKQQQNNGKKKDKKQKQSPSKQDQQKNPSQLNPIRNLQDSLCLTNQNKDIDKDKDVEAQNPTNGGLLQGSMKACRQKFKLNNCSFVIQKYIQKPFLIQGRKFDIRVWALLTQNMELFFFKEAYIRTSAEIYSTDNIGNYFIHLTNNAIQKNAQNYGQFENGNQLSFKSLAKYMEPEKVSQIWSKIKEITYMAFSSVKKKINFYQRRNCFELFGLDYFISYDQKVWLIEVNENPCIQCSSPLLGQLIPRMLNDAFKLTIDQIIDKKPVEDKPYHVDGYQDSQSMWQSLGQLIPNAQYVPNSNKKAKKLSPQTNGNLINP